MAETLIIIMKMIIKRLHVFKDSERSQHVSSDTIFGVQEFLNEDIYAITTKSILEKVDLLVVTTEGGFSPNERILLHEDGNDKNQNLFVKAFQVDTEPQVYLYIKE